MILDKIPVLAIFAQLSLKTASREEVQHSYSGASIGLAMQLLLSVSRFHTQIESAFAATLH